SEKTAYAANSEECPLRTEHLLIFRHSLINKTSYLVSIDLIGPDVAKIRTLAISMFKIEKMAEGNATVLRLVGRINAQHLDELNQMIANPKSKVFKLDLSEVTLVDLNVVRFLGDQERQGLELVKCSPYIREWIQREQ